VVATALGGSLSVCTDRQRSKLDLNGRRQSGYVGGQEYIYLAGDGLATKPLDLDTGSEPRIKEDSRCLC
jgi:hypothetical protein